MNRCVASAAKRLAMIPGVRGLVSRAGAVLAVVACACLGTVAPAPAGSGDEVLLPRCGNVIAGGEVAPLKWSSGCLSGSINLDNLSWQNWGAATATATGVIHLNACDPYCLAGNVYDFPARLTVDKIERCASSLGPRRYYLRFSTVVDFPAENEFDQPPGPSEPTTYSSSCPNPGYLVKTRRGPVSFGAFTQGGEYDGSNLDNYFGPPSRRHRDGRYTCVKHWRSIGLTVHLGVFDASLNPCEAGLFFRAILHGSRWHTPGGVRPGSPARKAAADSIRRCTIRLCRTRGYVLSQHYSVCADGRYPTVVAATKRGHVSRLLVYTTFCE